MLDITGLSVGLPEKSTANLPDAMIVSSGHATEMDWAVVLTNILAILEERKESPDHASRAAGAPDSIRNLKRAVAKGKGGLHSETLFALCKYLKTSPEALSTPPSPMPPPVADGEAALLREFLTAQRDLLDRQIQALDADVSTEEPPHNRRHSKNR